jgi:hypothetical protein
MGAVDDGTGEVAAGQRVTGRPALNLPAVASADATNEPGADRQAGEAIPYGIQDLAADRDLDDL